MRPWAVYNENDPHAAEWLENLIRMGAIAPGIVDRRSIEDISPEELREFTQVHFFAGIGGWSHALRLAGWEDHQPIWTGSCPCQPFSGAGKGSGFDDPRHLWPAMRWHMLQRGPGAVLGEQVSSPDGLAWIDHVFADCEAAGYATWAVDICGAGLGAPEIRQRLYWLAHSLGAGLEGHARHGDDRGEPRWFNSAAAGSTPEGRTIGRMAHPDRRERQGITIIQGPERDRHYTGRQESLGGIAACGKNGELALSLDGGERPGKTDGFWRDADWLFSRDGKWRPVEPGAFPLVDGSAFDLGSGSAFEGKSHKEMLKGYGNGIIIDCAVEFILTVKDHLLNPY